MGHRDSSDESCCVAALGVIQERSSGCFRKVWSQLLRQIKEDSVDFSVHIFLVLFYKNQARLGRFAEVESGIVHLVVSIRRRAH